MADQPNLLQPRFQPGFGADCHMKGSGYIPVCVVTDLDNRILIRNMEPDPKSTKWLATRARVSINRFWTSSNAVIRCSIASEDLGLDFPRVGDGQQIARFYDQRGRTRSGTTTPVTPKPNNPRSSGSNPSVISDTPADESKSPKLQVAQTSSSSGPLDILDEICIYLGYIDSLRPVVDADITAGRLKRVFVGVVDTITATGTNREGTSIMIQCRDRMKYLMDTLGTYNSADSIEIAPALTEGSDPAKLNRSSVILTVARRAIGDLRFSSALKNNEKECDFVGGVGISPGLIVDFVGDKPANAPDGGPPATVNGSSVTLSDSYNPYSPYSPSRDITGPSLSADFSTHKEKPSPVLVFNILTGRPGYEQSDLKYNFQVTDRVSVEYIRYLSAQEPWPTELFCHHQTGEYWYVPRGTDVSGFDDPKRYYRTYFYRRYPAGLTLGSTAAPPHIAQMCISFREERSAIGWRSNIIVSNSRTTDNAQKNQAVHLTVKPPWLKNRAMPVSYYTATDPTAGGATTLGAIALSLARALGKEVKAGTARFLGDPTFSPGEAVQVMGSPLNPDPLTEEKRKEDVQLAKTLRDAYADLVVEVSEKIKDANEDTNELALQKTAATEPINIVSSKAEDAISTKLFCPAIFNASPDGGAAAQSQGIITLAEEPKSIWRAEGVTHYYHDGEAGYFTELSLVSAF
jgi:hypothetical protein